MSTSNKNAATEDEVGALHGLITKGFTKVVSHQIEKFDNGGAEDKDWAIDVKALAAAAKWVDANEVTCIASVSDKKNKLHSKVQELKDRQAGKVIPIRPEEEQYG